MTITEQRTWEGASALEPFLVPIEDLSETPGNPNIGNVKEIVLSLQRFGQERAIVIWGDRIVAGHHVWKAAKRLGWTHIAAIAGDFADEGEATAFLLADNRLAALAETDVEAWVQMTMPLAEANLLEGTGISQDFYDDQLALVAKVEEAAREVAEEGEKDERTVVLLVSPEEYDRLHRYRRILEQEYGTEGVKDTVLRALEQEAYRLNQAT